MRKKYSPHLIGQREDEIREPKESRAPAGLCDAGLVPSRHHLPLSSVVHSARVLCCPLPWVGLRSSRDEDAQPGFRTTCLPHPFPPFLHQWELRLSQEPVLMDQSNGRSGHEQG